MQKLRVGLVIAAALVVTGVSASPASAGRLLATGHDTDLHCAFGDQCHYVQVALNYVRGGAPDPSKPVLVLDKPDFDVPRAFDNAFGTGVVPHVVMEPQSPAFAAEPLTTDRYSAIVIASDTTCGGCDLNGPGDDVADSAAINARRPDIEAFFNAGGGIFANSGATHGDANPATGPDIYYDFVPLGLQGVAVSPPFCLTAVGRSIGLEDQQCPDPGQHAGTNDDINCCPTHNSFALPNPGTAIEVAEVDSQGQAETLIADGIISGGAIVKKPPEYGLKDEDAPEACGFTINGKSDLGTADGEKITGTEQSDLLKGGPGNDEIDGLGAKDCVFGNKGRDKIKGGSGDDKLRAGNNRDNVKGNDGDDNIRLQDGADKVNAGPGNDRVKAQGKRRGKGGIDQVGCGSGEDRATVDVWDVVKPNCERVRVVNPD